MRNYSFSYVSQSIPFKLTALALLLAGASSHSFATASTNTKIEITKITFDSGHINAISHNGNYAVGTRFNDALYRRATLWSGENWQATDLDTLKSDNSGESEARAISADENYIVGSAQDSNAHATLWSVQNREHKINLGTLRSDNLGSSAAWDISNDGKYIVGYSHNTQYHPRATLWSGYNWQDKTDLGTLRQDNLGASEARAITPDGSYIVGYSWNDQGLTRATVWSGANWTTKTDLGSLKSDDTNGFPSVSTAFDVSADGRYIVGHSAHNTDYERAVLWSGKNWQIKTELGTLKSDNSGNSAAYAISSNGNHIVGYSYNDDGSKRATLWSIENGEAGKAIDLGTLRDDNLGEAEAYTISADGSVIGVLAETNDGRKASSIYKIRYITNEQPPVPQTENPTPDVPPTGPEQPTPPVAPTPKPEGDTTVEVVKKVDVGHTQQILREMGNSTLALAESQRLALQRLHYYCSPSTAGKACYQVEAEWSQQGKVKDNAMALGIGYRFHPNLSMNLKFDRSFARQLPKYYQKQNSNHGIGIALAWHLPTNNGEWYLQPSFAWNSYDVQVIRPVLDNTEAGVGNSKMQGKSYRLTLGNSLNFADNKTVDTYLGVEHSQVKRSGYTEQKAEFPVTFANLTDKNTALFAGVQAKLPITQNLAWLAGVEMARSINSTPATYSATADYIGQFNYQENSRKNSLKFNMGLHYQITPAMAFNVQPYYNVAGKHHRGVSLGLRGEF